MTQSTTSRSPSCEASPPDRVPLAHGLTAIIVRYGDDEPRRPRPKLLSPDKRNEQRALDAYDEWMQAQGNDGGGVA